MDDLRTLLLFSSRQVLPFPVCRQASKVRGMAEELLSLDPEMAGQHTKIVALGIRRRMVRQGFSDLVIEREVATFMVAVHQGMVRIAHGQRHVPDGAA